MNPFYLKFLLAIYLCFISLISAAQQNTFTRLFIFGDSLSDTGNAYKLYRGFLPISPPYFGGRFSNGKVWTEHFSQQLNLSQEQVFNFAFGGARANQGKLPVPSLDKQIAKYLKWNPNGADPNALYVVWIGSNDIINDENERNDFRVVSRISNQVKKQLNILIKHGARTFLVPNLPAMSLSPHAQEQDAKNKNSGYSEHLDKMVNNYNGLLQDNLNKLEIENPTIKIISFDTYYFIKNIIDYAESFGINNVYERCNPNGYLDARYKICNNPDEYLFWDSMHPSASGHTLLSFFITNTLYSNGFIPNKNYYIENEATVKIYENNINALSELTTDHINQIDYENIKNNELLF